MASTMDRQQGLQGVYDSMLRELAAVMEEQDQLTDSLPALAFLALTAPDDQQLRAMAGYRSAQRRYKLLQENVEILNGALLYIEDLEDSPVQPLATRQAESEQDSDRLLRLAGVTMDMSDHQTKQKM